MAPASVGDKSPIDCLFFRRTDELKVLIDDLRNKMKIADFEQVDIKLVIIAFFASPFHSSHLPHFSFFFSLSASDTKG